MDLSVIARNWRLLAQGFLVSLELFAVAVTGALLLGILVGLGRLSSKPWIYYPVTAYVNIMRNIPLVLVIFWVYFILPLFRGTAAPPFVAAAIAFIIFEATYYGEIIRAGFRISRGPVMAGLASGLTHWQTVRYILIPIGLKRVLPSLLTQSIVMFQDTTLAYVIGLREFLRAAAAVDAREVRSLELYGLVGLVYFIVCLTASRLTHRLEAKGIAAKRADRDQEFDQAVRPVHGA
ncbi:MAG TPA: amino acid ABC transporter permease [Limnochordales bacterium]